MRSWRPAIRVVRPGDTIYVYALVIVPRRRGHDDSPPAAQVGEFMADIHSRGGHVFEAYTGLDSSVEIERRAMMKAAINGLRSSGKPLPDIGRKPGRPKTEWPSPEAEAEARRVWASSDYTTREVASRHMPPGVNATLINRLGPRGKPKRKRK